MNWKQRIASLRAAAPKMSVDGILFAAAYVLAFQLRVENIDPFAEVILITAAPLVLFKVGVYHLMGSYRSIWRYSSLTDLEELVRATIVCGIGVAALAFLVPRELGFPRSIPIIDMALALLFTGGARMAVRVLHETSGGGSNPRKISRRLIAGRSNGGARRALIVGAGDAGEMMVREMMRSSRMDYAPVALVDDDPVKHGSSIHGIPVLGGREAIPHLVQQHGIKDILIAIPSARGKTVREIVQVCENTSAGLKILPDLSRLADGKVHVSDLRQVQVEDLLGREPAELDLNLISSYIRGKRVLVTGAGGSIGSELCRQILKFAPAEIHLMGRGENSIYEIYNELARTAGFTRLVQVIGD
ncbi:MAG TPA: polysaccharide biosynthesis protein, partial [Candidatus Bathyarchaeia archaeon]|nr:polysaccharide biosynthesis protein [Candidatus Bathyarchaeia archaeon]